jgi:RNA polymerase sigma-70 factor (ECF subfamily)
MFLHVEGGEMTGEKSPQEPDEQDLVAKVLSGDASAFVALLHRSYGRLEARIRSNIPEDLHRSLDAADVRQQVFSKAWRSRHTFQSRGQHSFYAWLARIADNTLIDEIRKQHARPRQVSGQRPAGPLVNDQASSVVELLELVGFHEETPSRAAARREGACAVRVALTTLPPRQREAVTLVYLQQLSREEAAQRMGTTQAGVRSLVHRGLEKLRETLGSMSKYLSRK